MRHHVVAAVGQEVQVVVGHGAFRARKVILAREVVQICPL